MSYKKTYSSLIHGFTTAYKHGVRYRTAQLLEQYDYRHDLVAAWKIRERNIAIFSRPFPRPSGRSSSLSFHKGIR